MSNRDTDGSQLQFGDDEASVALRKAWKRALRALAPNLTPTSESFLRGSEPVAYHEGVVVVAAPSRFAREWLEKRHGEALRAQLAASLGGGSLTLKFVLAGLEHPRQPLAGRLAALPAPAPAARLLPAPGVSAENAATDAASPSGGEPEPDADADPDLDHALVPLPRGGQKDSLAAPLRAGEGRAAAADGGSTALGGRRKALPPELSMPLSDKYTFDTFVVGKSNRLAHAGAMAVAGNPGAVYNPLFLYGAPGLGKTHLMHAIGHAIRQRQPGARVAYVSGESFTNGYIAALRESKSDQFRSVYRNVDVWLVDDIQTIAGKEHTKEEFFHTFNTLHQVGRQIVLSSDRPPRELRLMDERLRSRFESGLIADVAPPELEMRVAILQRKALLDNLPIPDDVLSYMAGLIQSNIRALEGALIRLTAFASLSKSSVTKELARDVLGSYFVENRALAPAARSADGDAGGEYGDGLTVSEAPVGGSALRTLPLPPRISRLEALQISGEELFQHIMDAVAHHFGVPAAALAGDGSAAAARRREYAAPRQVAIYLARERTPLPVTELARLFGDVNHSAISHAHKKMARALQDDPLVMAAVQAIVARLEE